MYCFICEICGGKMNLNSHNDVKWVLLDELSKQNWIPTDIQVVGN